MEGFYIISCSYAYVVAEGGSSSSATDVGFETQKHNSWIEDMVKAFRGL